jgi:hypothetical protein
LRAFARPIARLPRPIGRVNQQAGHGRHQWVLAALLIVVFLWQSFASSRQKSPVFDEPPHIASGLSYLATHTFNANPQHPPLLKELSALSLMSAGIRWPKTELADSVIKGGPDGANMEWPVGNDIIAANGPDRVMFWARLPLILLAGVLGLLLYLWAREMLGPGAALGALFLYALDPTIVGHSYLVTTDVGVTAFTVLFLFLLWRYLNHASRARLIACGLALGAAMGAKFSAVLLLPLAGILLLAKKRDIVSSLIAFASMSAIAVLVVEALYFFPRDPSLYIEGFGRVNADHLVGQQAFFNGELAPRFYSYFAAAYLHKEPLASIALAAAGLALLWRGPSTPVLTKLFLLLPPVFFVLTVTFMADDLGVRYIMPALPFAYMLGGLALSKLAGGTWPWRRPAVAAIGAWIVVAAAGIYPDHLSYFNEAACLIDAPERIGIDGGSRCGPLWLDDSNVDWGQGLKQLRAWADQHGAGRTLRLAYFGTFPPAGYGLNAEKIDPQTLISRPAPGLYAVSAFWVGRVPAAVEAVAPGATSWLRQVAPVAIVGHAFYIYDIH